MAKQYVIYRINRKAKGENGTNCFTVKSEDDFNKCVRFHGCRFLMIVKNKGQLEAALEAIRKVGDIEDEYTYLVKQTKWKQYEV